MCKNKIDFEKIVKTQRLHCVWIRARDLVNAPLISVWIDSRREAFQDDSPDRAHSCAAMTARNPGDQDEPGGFGIPDMAGAWQINRTALYWTKTGVNYSLCFVLSEVN